MFCKFYIKIEKKLLTAISFDLELVTSFRTYGKMPRRFKAVAGFKVSQML